MRFSSLLLFLLMFAASAAEIGGTFPWRTLQAEEAATNAERLKPSRRAGDFAAECVGRSGVRLNRIGDYVEFTAPAAVNSIVVRYAIPDAPRGGGEEHTLSGYVDGKHRFDLKLSSRHTWLYGREHDPVNDPEELKRMHTTDILVWNNYGAEPEIPDHGATPRHAVHRARLPYGKLHLRTQPGV